MKQKIIKGSKDKHKEHLMKVCPHGVSHGYLCVSCGKLIEIPRDASIKPEGYVEPKEETKEDK